MKLESINQGHARTQENDPAGNGLCAERNEKDGQFVGERENGSRRGHDCTNLCCSGL